MQMRHRLFTREEVIRINQELKATGSVNVNGLSEGSIEFIRATRLSRAELKVAFATARRLLDKGA